jgi:hypothetical protein
MKMWKNLDISERTGHFFFVLGNKNIKINSSPNVIDTSEEAEEEFIAFRIK